MKFHLWWFIMYLSSICYFNSNRCNGFILGSHLSDVLGSLSDYYFFFFCILLIYFCVQMCMCTCLCVWGGDLGLCVYGGQKRVPLEFQEFEGVPGLLCEYWYLNSSLLICTVRVLRHGSSLQPPLPMYMESLLWFLSSLISLIFQVSFIHCEVIFLSYTSDYFLCNV